MGKEVTNVQPMGITTAIARARSEEASEADIEKAFDDAETKRALGDIVKASNDSSNVLKATAYAKEADDTIADAIEKRVKAISAHHERLNKIKSNMDKMVQQEAVIRRDLLSLEHAVRVLEDARKALGAD